MRSFVRSFVRSFPGSTPRRQPAPSHDNALAAGGWLIRVLRLLDLCNQQLKALVDVLVVAGAGLGPATAVLLRQQLAILGRDLALLGAKIGLVAHDDDRDPLDALLKKSGDGCQCQGCVVFWKKVKKHKGQRTRWFSSFSRMTWTISKEDLEATE